MTKLQVKWGKGFYQIEMNATYTKSLQFSLWCFSGLMPPDVTLLTFLSFSSFTAMYVWQEPSFIHTAPWQVCLAAAGTWASLWTDATLFSRSCPSAVSPQRRAARALFIYTPPWLACAADACTCVSVRVCDRPYDYHTSLHSCNTSHDVSTKQALDKRSLQFMEEKLLFLHFSCWGRGSDTGTSPCQNLSQSLTHIQKGNETQFLRSGGKKRTSKE